MKKFCIATAMTLALLSLNANANESANSNVNNTGINTMNEKTQQLIKKEEQTTFVGDEKYFTGKVNVRMIFPSTEHNAYSMGLVEFEQGARSAWHTHPAGQQLVVVKGRHTPRQKVSRFKSLERAKR